MIIDTIRFLSHCALAYLEDPMSLLDEYYARRSMPPQDVAKRILFAVFEDLLGRRGIRHEIERCDPEIQEEILATNLAQIKKELGEV